MQFYRKTQVSVASVTQVMIGQRSNNAAPSLKAHVTCLRLFNQALNEAQLKKSMEACNYKRDAGKYTNHVYIDVVR